MPRFNLQRYFMVTSVVIMVVVAAVVGVLNGRNTERLLVAEGEAHAIESAQTLARHIHDEFIEPRRQVRRQFDLGEAHQYRQLDQVVQRGIVGMQIREVNLFDHAGTVLYSTNPTVRGHTRQLGSHLYQALRGRVASELYPSGVQTHPDRAPNPEATLETYIPLERVSDVPAEHWGPLAVIETYQDASDIYAQIRAGMRRAIAESALSSLALFAALMLIVRRADRTLRNQRRELEAWNRRLEERVTERTAAAERSAEDIRRLFDGITDGIGLLEPDLSVHTVNDGIRQLAGLDGTPVPEGTFCYRLFAHRATPCPGCPAEATLRTGQPASAQITWELDGQSRQFEITTFPLASTAGEPARLIEYIKEVTDRRLMEQQLIQAERLASIGVLAAGVAHEINNPLASVTQCMYGIRRQLLEAQRGDTDVDEYLTLISREIDRCKAITQNLLTFARPSRSAREVTDALEIVRDTHALLRIRFEQFNVTWQLEAEQDSVPIVTDGTKFRQVLFNLLHNALDACADDGGTITCRVAAENGTVRIAVDDTGIGMTPETLARVFEPFFTSKSPQAGTGLGLSLAYSIAQELGGSLHAASPGPGQGATFVFIVPTRSAP